MSDYTETYRDLIILQYWDKPKARGEIELLASEGEFIYDFFRRFETEFDIDQAYGHRLDLIGKIVGVSRIVENGIAKKFFAFAGTPNGRTFGQGPMFHLFNDTGFTDTELNDNQMRFFIRAKVAKNIASAFMVSDDRISLQDTIQVLFRSKAFVVDNYNMTLTLYIDDTFPQEDILLLQAQDLIPNPQGVGYRFIIQYSEEGTFAFAGNPNTQAKTFGQGKFARLVV